MHTINMSFSIHDQPPIIYHAKLITNSLVPTHNIHSTWISTPLYNKSMNQPIKQPTIFMKRSIAKTQARSHSSWESSLRREECSRSNCRLRLGETATVTLGNFADSHLGETISPERDSSSLKKQLLAWAKVRA